MIFVIYNKRKMSINNSYFFMVRRPTFDIRKEEVEMEVKYGMKILLICVINNL